MEIVDTLGGAIMSTLSTISPNALMVALGVFVLGLACASIGWIIRGPDPTASEADTSHNSDARPIVPALPYLGATSDDIRDSTGLHSHLEETQVVDVSEYDSTTTRSSSILNSTLASTAEGLRTLGRGRKKQQLVFEEQRKDLEVSLRSTAYKLKTREAELKEFRSRSTDELRFAKDRIKELESNANSHKHTKNQVLHLTETNRDLEKQLSNIQSGPDLKAANKALRNEVATQKQANETYRKNIDALQQKVNTLKKSDTDLQNVNREIQHAQIEAEKTSIETRQQQTQLIAERDAEIQQLRATLDLNKKETLELTSKLTEIQTKHDESKVLEQQQQRKLSSLEAELEKTSRHAKEIGTEQDRKVKELNNQVEAQQQELKQQSHLLTKSQAATESAKFKLDEIERKRTTYRDETSKEISTLKERVSDLSKFETANLNQQTTIRKLEEQLAESRSKQSELEEKSGSLIHATSENEKLAIKIDSLQKALTDVTDNNASLDGQNIELKSQLSTLDKQKFELVKNVQNLELRQSESRDAAIELERLRRQTRQQDEKIKGLTSSLDQARSSETQIKQAKSTISEQTVEIARLEEKCVEFESNAKESENEHRRQIAQIEKLQAKSTGLIAEVERSKSNVETLNDRISGLEEDASAHALRLQAMSKAKDTLQHEKKSLESDIGDIRARFREQSNLLEKTSRALDSSKDEYNTAQVQIAKLQSSIKTIDESRAADSEEISELRQRNKSMQDTLTAKTAELEKASEKANNSLSKSEADLQQALTQHKADTNSWRSARNEFSVREQDLSATISSLQQGLKQKEIEITELSGFKAELELKTRQNDSFRKQIEETRLSGKLHKEKTAELQIELAAYEQKYATVSHDLKGLKQTMAAMEATHRDSLKKETSRISLLLENAEKSSSESASQVKDLKGQLHAIEVKSKKAEAQNKQLLQNEIQSAEQALAAKLTQTHKIELEAGAKKNAELQKQLLESEDQAKKLAQNLVQEKHLQDTIKEQQQQGDKQLVSVRAELEAITKARDGVAEKLEVTTNQALRSESDLSEVQDKLASTKELLENRETQIENEKKLSLELREQHERSSRQLQSMTTTLEELKRSVATQNEKLRAAEVQEQQTSEELVKVRKEVSLKATDLESEQNKLKQVQQSFQKSQQELASQKAALETARKAQEASSKQQSEDAKLLSTLKATVAERDSALSNTRKLQEKNVQLENSVSSYESQVQGLKNELGQKSTDIVTLETGLEQAGKELNARSDEANKYKSRLMDVEKLIEEERKNAAETEKTLLGMQSSTKETQARKQKIEANLAELRKTVVERDKTIIGLQREHEQFKSLKGLVAQRQSDIESLRSQIDRLSRLEASLHEKNALLEKTRTELAESARMQTNQASKIKSLESTLSEANKQIASYIRRDNQPDQLNEHEEANPVEFNRLNAQVKSLTNERNLGLERVKELSEIAKSIDEKDKIIRELRNGLSDSKVSDRELDLLRVKISRQDADLRNKKLTIEQLKRDLTRLSPNTAKATKANKRVTEGLELLGSQQAKTGKKPSRSKRESQGAGLNGSRTDSRSDNRNEIMDDDTLTVEVVSEKPAKVTASSTAAKAAQADTSTAPVTVEQTQSVPEPKSAATAAKSSKSVAKSATLYTAPAEKDDLKRIKGIGPVMETTLYSLGVTSYRQIAEFTAVDIARVSEALDAFH